MPYSPTNATQSAEVIGNEVHHSETCDATTRRVGAPEEVETGSTPLQPRTPRGFTLAPLSAHRLATVFAPLAFLFWGSASRVGNPASSQPHRRASTPHIYGSLRGSLRSPALRSHRFAHKTVLASLRSVSGSGSPITGLMSLRGSLRFPHIAMLHPQPCQIRPFPSVVIFLDSGHFC